MVLGDPVKGSFTPPSHHPWGHLLRTTALDISENTWTYTMEILHTHVSHTAYYTVSAEIALPCIHCEYLAVSAVERLVFVQCRNPVSP